MSNLGRRRLIPKFEQVTCNVPIVTPMTSAISSRLIPRSTRLRICCILSGVYFVGLPRLRDCNSNEMPSVILQSLPSLSLGLPDRAEGGCTPTTRSKYRQAFSRAVAEPLARQKPRTTSIARSGKSAIVATVAIASSTVFAASSRGPRRVPPSNFFPEAPKWQFSAKCDLPRGRNGSFWWPAFSARLILELSARSTTTGCSECQVPRYDSPYSHASMRLAGEEFAIQYEDTPVP